MVKISIIIPVYNVENYIERCIDSVLNQTISDFEVIIINDGSTDKSGQICDEYMKKDKRIKVYHIENSGASRARNIGIKKSNGKYIAFIDSDDYIKENMYENLVNIADKENLDVVICNYNTVDKIGNIIGEPRHSIPCDVVLQKKGIYNHILKEYYGGNIVGVYSLWNKLFNREIIINNNILINEELYMGEDLWFNFDVYLNANKIKAIEDVYYYYELENPNSIMKMNKPDLVDSWIYTLEKLLNINDELFNFDIDYNKFYRQFITNVSYYIIKVLNSNDYTKKQKSEIINKILNNQFYKNSVKYDKYVNKKVKLLNIGCKINANLFTKCTYKICSLVYKV